MPNISQVNNLVQNNKSYSTSLGNNNEQGEQFDILKLNKPTAVESTTDKEAGGSRAMLSGGDLSPLTTGQIKEPSMAVDTLRDIINSDMLENAKLSGYTELYGELDALVKNLYLGANDLVGEMQNQEEQNTIFSGNKFFDILRDLADKAESIANPELKATIKENIASLLKAINFAESKNDILGALSSNMKYLSQHFASNTQLSSKLMTLSEAWGSSEAPKNFEELKNATMSVIKEASQSLLNDEHSQALLPLVTHNMSRYNTNKYMLKEAFTQLMTGVSSQSARNGLVSSFKEVLTGLFGKKAADDFFSSMKAYSQPQVVSTSNDENVQNDELSHYNNTTNIQKNQPQNVIFGKESQIPSFFSTRMSNSEYISSLNLTKNEIEAPLRSYLLGKTDGMTAVKNTISALISDTHTKTLLSSEMDNIKSVDELVDYLNDILKELPDFSDRMSVFDSLKEIVTMMSEKRELPLHAPAVQTEAADVSESKTTLDGLTDFIEKNINHSALKSVENYNASNLLQSLLNAPGVTTPLAHYILPLQIEDTRAFGELWVDNEEEKHSSQSVDAKKSYHLFLTFDVESIGRFEVNMVSLDDRVDISLLHPESFENNIKPIVSKINRIVAGMGYATNSFNTAVLSKPHSLTEVFPILNEKRAGFNVKA